MGSKVAFVKRPEKKVLPPMDTSGEWSLECLKPAKFNHRRRPQDMKPGQVINEYLYLMAGHADETEVKGVKLGLRPELETRKQELRRYLMTCITMSRVPPVP